MSISDGLTKKEGFKAEASSPPAAKCEGASRPKHDSMVKRHVKSGKK